jgi:hypothetical protein
MNYWRDSEETSTLYKCDNFVCKGSVVLDIMNVDASTSRIISSPLNTTNGSGQQYCTKGHSGPLCEVCVDKVNYFSPSNGKCYDCPSFLTIAKTIGMIVHVIIAIIAAGLRLVKSFRSLMKSRNMTMSAAYEAPSMTRIWSAWASQKVYILATLPTNISLQA